MLSANRISHNFTKFSNITNERENTSQTIYVPEQKYTVQVKKYFDIYQDQMLACYCH